MSVMDDVFAEIKKQDRVYGQFNTTAPGVFHGLNVLREELEEARSSWRLEKANSQIHILKDNAWKRTVEELTQVAAASLRLLRDIVGEEI